MEKKTMACRECGGDMHHESRHTLEFVNGRGKVELDRFHCPRCRKFHNEPAAQPSPEPVPA